MVLDYGPYVQADCKVGRTGSMWSKLRTDKDDINRKWEKGEHLKTIKYKTDFHIFL